MTTLLTYNIYTFSLIIKLVLLLNNVKGKVVTLEKKLDLDKTNSTWNKQLQTFLHWI